MTRRIGYPEAFRNVDPSTLWCDPKTAIPDEWAPRGRWRIGQAMHTFTDDYRQEFFWRRPEEGALIATAAHVCTAPDYTVWVEDPDEWARHQAWRSAVVGAFWQSRGVTVIPVMSWCSALQDYIAPGSLWAVRGPRRDDNGSWRERAAVFEDTLEPGAVLVFGNEPSAGAFSCPVIRRPLNSSKVEALHTKRDAVPHLRKAA